MKIILSTLCFFILTCSCVYAEPVEAPNAPVIIKTATFEVKTSTLEVKPITAVTPTAETKTASIEIKTIVPPVQPTVVASSAAVPAPVPMTLTFSPKMSIKEIIKISVLPSDAPDGAELYGFKYFKGENADKGPGSEGWYKIIESSTILLKPESPTKEAVYSVYLQASAVTPWYKLDNIETGPYKEDYIENTIKELENLVNLNKDRYESVLPVNGIGDLCFQGEGDLSTVYSARGPFIFIINVKPFLRVANWSPSQIDQKFKIEEKTALCLSPELINARALYWRGVASSISLQLMKDYLAKFDEWYASPVAKGNGMKGYYWPDMSVFLLEKEELPGKLSIDGKFEPKSANPASAAYKGAGKNEKYKVALLARYPLAADEKIESALDSAKDYYKVKVTELKKASAISIKGADEAVRINWKDKGNNDKIIFRCDNIVCEIYGKSEDSKAKPLPLAQKLAEKIAAKISDAGIK